MGGLEGPCVLCVPSQYPSTTTLREASQREPEGARMVHTGGAAGKVASFACNWCVGHVEGPYSLVLLLPSHPRPSSCLDADLEALGHGEQEAGNEQAALGPGTADSYIWVSNHGGHSFSPSLHIPSFVVSNFPALCC